MIPISFQFSLLLFIRDLDNKVIAFHPSCISRDVGVIKYRCIDFQIELSSRSHCAAGPSPSKWQIDRRIINPDIRTDIVIRHQNKVLISCILSDKLTDACHAVRNLLVIVHLMIIAFCIKFFSAPDDHPCKKHQQDRLQKALSSTDKLYHRKSRHRCRRHDPQNSPVNTLTDTFLYDLCRIRKKEQKQCHTDICQDIADRFFSVFKNQQIENGCCQKPGKKAASPVIIPELQRFIYHFFHYVPYPLSTKI